VTVAIFALVGVVLGIFSQWLLQRRSRAEARADRLRTDRCEAYVALLVSVNECAHQLARVCEHGYGAPSDAEARAKAAYFFDQDVTPRHRVVELVGTPEAVDAAAEMRADLVRFRDRVTKRDRPAPAYRTDDYNQVYEPFRQARGKFVAAARADLR
jgi:hypothetical protein